MTKDIIFGTGASANKDFNGILSTVRTAVQNGIYCFDTAPSYKTEKILGQALKTVCQEQELARDALWIQTKIDAWQMQESNGNVRKYVDDVIDKMGIEYLDSLLIHWPIPEYFDNTWKSFVKLYEDGIVKKIGVCNVRMRQLKKLINYDFPPQIVQIERNPLRTCLDEINFCKEHGIAVQAYSPLCKMDRRLSESEVLKDISESNHKSIGQIILRWHIDTGVTPIFTSRKPSRIKEYSEIFDFTLTAQEIASISDLNINYKMYLESFACPGL